MIRIQTETRTEMMCMKEAIEDYCKTCKQKRIEGIDCTDCNYNNITYELIDLKFSKPVERWDFDK